MSRAQLVEEIERARAAVAVGLARVDVDLAAEYPEPIGPTRVRTDAWLVHLAAHLAYHLGQVDTHRRVVTGDSEGVGALRPAELEDINDRGGAG